MTWPLSLQLPLLAGGRQSDNPTSLARTRLAGHSADVPNADSGGWDLGETCERPRERLVESGAAAPHKAAKRSVSHAMSRLPAEFRFRGLRASGRILPILCLSFIQERAQCWPGTRIVNNPFPSSITVHFRKHRRQLNSQLLPIFGRKRTNGISDLLKSAHSAKLLGNAKTSKPRLGNTIGGDESHCASTRQGRRLAMVRLSFHNRIAKPQPSTAGDSR